MSRYFHVNTHLWYVDSYLNVMSCTVMYFNLYISMAEFCSCCCLSYAMDEHYVFTYASLLQFYTLALHCNYNFLSVAYVTDFSMHRIKIIHFQKI